MLKTYQALGQLYASEQSDEEKLTEKATLLSALEERIGAKRPINNATLVDLRLYRAGEADLEALYRACGDWPSFLSALEDLTPQSFTQEHEEVLGPVLQGLDCA